MTEIQSIPGIGPRIAGNLADLGIARVEDLRGKNPERMYRALCELRGGCMDRCLLYVFRSAVYFAENESHDPELLKWWNWKDDNGSRRRCLKQS